MHPSSSMILLIDNYDSFVHNLARYFQLLGQETRVVRNDELGVDEIRAMKPAAIVLSPGPCTPNEAGCSLEVVEALHRQVPMLGICLGHQTIAAAFGGQVVRADEPRHGRTSEIEHDGHAVFAGVPASLSVCRYHSLIVEEESLPAELVVTARSTDDQAIMALAHRELPVVGLQFHPEAVLTSHGFRLLANFLQLAGTEVDVSVSELATAENRTPPPLEEPEGLGVAPGGPITF
ncbi:MAG: aminodeoxychorismate/anthranilate synthase component II [Lacipirellulaceae bacterium]